jgi:hypothetical protein
MSDADERLWSALAHLSALLNAVTGFLGVVISFVIYLAYKDRSEKVAFHALQATYFQLVFIIGAGVLASVFGFVTVMLATVLIGIICIPIAGALVLIPVGAMIYALLGGLQVYQGETFRYALVADWAEPKSA